MLTEIPILETEVSPPDPLVLFVDRRTWELHVRPRSRIPRDAFLVLTDPFVKETPSDAPDL